MKRFSGMKRLQGWKWKGKRCERGPIPAKAEKISAAIWIQRHKHTITFMSRDGDSRPQQRALEDSAAQRKPQERPRVMYYRKAWSQSKDLSPGAEHEPEPGAVGAETWQTFSLLKKNVKRTKMQVSRCASATETFCCETCKTWIFSIY